MDSTRQPPRVMEDHTVGRMLLHNPLLTPQIGGVAKLVNQLHVQGVAVLPHATPFLPLPMT